MKREEITVQAKLKPNCGLENTRASLVMRRIAPLCDSAACHPHAIKSSRETIPYLRDHGLFVTFVSRTPERVLAAISGAFFVDSCTIVEDPEGIPPFEMPSAPQEDDAENRRDRSDFFVRRSRCAQRASENAVEPDRAAGGDEPVFASARREPSERPRAQRYRVLVRADPRPPAIHRRPFAHRSVRPHRPIAS